AGRAARARGGRERCGPAGWATDSRVPARPRRSTGLSGTLARDAQPGGLSGELPIDGRLYVADRFGACRNTGAAGHGQIPDALHVGPDLAVAVGAHAPAGPVAQALRTVHGAGHAGGAEDALAAHAAIEQQSFY